MKKIMILSILISLPVTSIFARSQPTALTDALNELQLLSQQILATAAFLLLILGIVLSVMALAIFLIKVKGKQGTSGWWKFAAYGFGILSVLAFFGTVVSIITYVLVPNLIEGLLG